MHSGLTLRRFSGFTLERPSLDQFILLSLMLHVLVIVLFGDTTGGGARRGEKLWGALTVTVQGLLPNNGVGLKLDRDASLRQRPTTRPPPAPALREPPRNREEAEPTPASAAPPTEEAPAPSPSPPIEIPPLISKEVEKPETEFVVPKPAIERSLAQSVERAPREAPPIPPPIVSPPVIASPVPEASASPKIERAIVPPIAPSKVIETTRDPVPVAVPAAAPAPAPLPAKIEPEVAKPAPPAPAPKPREVAPPVVQPIAPAPPKPERESVQPITETKPREIPVAPAPRAETPTPQREVATPVAPPATPAVAPAPTPSGTTAAKPSGDSNADNDLLKPRGDVRTPGLDTSGLTPPPGIDLDAVRRRAREISSGGPRTVFPFPVAPTPKPKSKEQQAFDKALKKNDCRDAYADMGLAAVVPLVLSAVREEGCKW